MSVWPPPVPQVAKPLMVPDCPITPSVSIGVPPEPSALKLPLVVLGSNPAIRLGVSGVQVGVNALGLLWFAAVIETTGATTLEAAASR